MTARSSAAFVVLLIFAAGGTAHVGSFAVADQDVIKGLGQRDATPAWAGADSHELDDNRNGRFAAVASKSF